MESQIKLSYLSYLNNTTVLRPSVAHFPKISMLKIEDDMVVFTTLQHDYATTEDYRENLVHKSIDP